MNAVATLLAGWALMAAPTESVVRVTLTVNTEPRGEIVARIADDDIWVAPMPELMRSTRGVAEVVDGVTWVSLKSLAPEITYVVDETDVSLAITLHDASALPETHIDARPKRLDDELVRRTPSAFLNYDLELQNFERGFANLELGATIGPGVLVSNGTAVAYDGFHPVRGLTTYTIDDRERMQRLSFGDMFVNGGVLGGANYFGGVVLARSFDLDPFFIYEPTLGFAGAASTPSTLDVYVGDVLIRREALPAGPFRLDGLPMMQGAGATRYVLRDAFGRETNVTTAQYGTRRLLGAGLTDYVASIGFARRGFGRESFDYEGSPSFLGRYRRGFSNDFTAETRLELTPWLVSGGASFALRTPAGVFSATAAGSAEHRVAGAAAQADWSYVSRRFSLALYGQWTSDRYANSSLAAIDDRARLEGSAQVAVPVGSRAALSLTYGRAGMRDGGPRDNGSAALSVSLSSNWLLLVTASRVTPAAGPSVTEGFATLRWIFGGGGGSVGAGAHAVNGRQTQALVDAQRPTPMTGGVGYRAQAAFNDDVEQATGELVYQSRYARASVRADRIGETTSTLATIAGGLVYMNDAPVYATRAVRQSYALVRVPGRENVRVLVDNREVGRTNAQGDVIVPELIPYFPHQFAIADADLAIHETLPATEQRFALTLRSGATVTFPVHTTRFLRGRLRLEEGSPAFGELTAHITANHDVVSPLGGHGDFELQDVPPGWYFADVEYAGGSCTAIIEVPAGDDFITELGDLRCAPREAMR